ncbi:MAG: hypothetical protein ACOX3W_05035 [Christensenellaceae bacterium]|jgi:NRPS condensation-like uncharacterized protein
MTQTKTAKRWMKLDNAAKIYPAARSRGWMALFRLSAELTEKIEPALLEQALGRTLKRFPAFAQQLKSGAFWNYLEHIEGIPKVEKDVQNPCLPMDFRRSSGFMLRVRYYNKRIAVEFFHVLTDGSGGMMFLKTLVAEYLTIKYGIDIPRGDDIFDTQEEATAGEVEDGFLKYHRGISRSRKEQVSYLVPGTKVKDHMFVTTGIMEARQVLAMAKKHDASLTEYLTAVLILAIVRVQNKKQPNKKKQKPVKICVPVNLRRYYKNNTTRNFASYINPGIEPKYGDYTLEEVIKIVKGQMAIESNEKLLNAKFSTNVLSEKNMLLRLAPWFVKRGAMKLVFHFKGDRYTSSSISNLGLVVLPEEMEPYVTRMDFMLGPLSRNKVACACLSYKGKLIFNITRTILESDVERYFFTSLVKQGIHVSIESNGGE